MANAKQEFETVGLRSGYYRFTEYILSFSQVCVSSGKGLASETNQEKNKWFIFPPPSVSFLWPCTGTAEQREALRRTEAPPGAGAPIDSKYPAPNRSTPAVYSHVNSGERSC